MDIATYKNDVWGREVLLGVSWELLWLICVTALIVVAVHAIYMATQQKAERSSTEGKRVQRHEPIDRIMHWVMAISILVLLFTGVLPIIGIEFAWLTLHWISGLVLTAAVLFHVRAHCPREPTFERRGSPLDPAHRGSVSSAHYHSTTGAGP